MADFNAAVAIVLANEGGATPSLDNNGAPVRLGLNRAANPGLDPSFYDGTMPAAEALALAQSVYRANYWNPILGDEITDQTLANHCMDMAVNAGVGAAVLLLQAVCNDFKTATPLVLDGGMGPVTIAAANLYGSLPQFVAAYRDARRGYYIAESLRDGNAQWRPVWLARVSACG